jgi:hypothetical protein
MHELIANLTQFVPNLQQTIILPGCGHWTQQERPDEVNAAMIEFLQSYDAAEAVLRTDQSHVSHSELPVAASQGCR